MQLNGYRFQITSTQFSGPKGSGQDLNALKIYAAGHNGTQNDAGKDLGVTQPRISQILKEFDWSKGRGAVAKAIAEKYDDLTQTEIGKILDRTQGWVSQQLNS